LPIVSILNPKGGSGKTTISTNLARALYERGHKVLLVDSDPQGSARDWHAANDSNPLPLVALDRANNVKSLPGVAASYDFVVVDGAAKLEDMIAASIKVADFVFIPVTPSPYDLWAASDLVEFIKARQEVTDGKPPARFIISRAISGTRLGDEIVAALSEQGLGVFATHVTQRQVYPQTASEGGTVFDSKNADALAEINALTDEILTFIETGGA
jgi:chromosome partitioning protein